MPAGSIAHLSPHAAIEDDPWPRIARRLSGEIPYVYTYAPYHGIQRFEYKLDPNQWIVYILLLDGRKFYVGITRDMGKRWRRHTRDEEYMRFGALWTRKYPPLAVIRTLIVDSQEEAVRHEKNTTIWLMHKYGVDNVRGGPWWTTGNISLPPFSEINNC
jgi:predicted GIY-YIG superfamily endonuclease